MRGITKNFGAVAALTDVDLDVSSSEIVAIVGDNGAGKSTLVKVLSGVHAPTSGTITFAGDEVSITSPTDALDRGIARAGALLPAFFANLTPLFAAMMSASLLGEPPRLFHVAAFALIVAGIVVSQRTPRPTRDEAA